jgi:iron complex outermembrane recepter protein
VVKDVVLPDGEEVDRSLPQAPSFSGNALVRYQWPMLAGTAAVETDFSYSGPQWFTVLEAPVDREGGRTIFNGRASYNSNDGHWSSSLSVSNLTNKIYRIYSLDISTIGLANSRYGPPRWYLFNVVYRFGGHTM